ncbi:hypothetical protein Hypma_014229 [Hypsizygus marmoreus]|uniref:Uncharacterized protein n=1 Tax=Hypsizygus marmoreus TaxID=39966 RepID=A0A369JFA9_HYPMA|nr:hypothetical protein Hypma_014229 [Hypsizygus marmoreus]
MSNESSIPQEIKNAGSTQTVYLLNDEFGWQNSQVSDTQAIEFLEQEYHAGKKYCPASACSSSPMKLRTDKARDVHGQKKRTSACVNPSRVMPRAIIVHQLESLAAGQAALHGLLTRISLHNTRLLEVHQSLLSSISSDPSHAWPMEAEVPSTFETAASSGKQILNPDQESQELIWQSSPQNTDVGSDLGDDDPYIPSLESQIECAIVGEETVVGKPPCVSREEYEAGYYS